MLGACSSSWCKPKPKYDNDAFASDFSDEWNGRRGAIPPNLAEVKGRNRFGEEVFHLTYNRISGSDEEKVWLCGEMAMEIATALKLFAELRDPMPSMRALGRGSVQWQWRGGATTASRPIRF